MLEKKETNLTFGDFQKFLAYIPKIPAFVSDTAKPPLPPKSVVLIFKLMFFCALRVKEVVKIKKSEINLTDRTITISDTPKRRLNKATITPNIIGELGDYIKNLKNEDYLFANTILKKHPPISRATIWKYAKITGELAGIKLFRPTQTKSFEGLITIIFQEAYKNFMLNNKANDSFVELKLRGRTTNDYGHYTIDDLKKWERRIFKQTLSEDEIKKYSRWYIDQYDFYRKLADKIKELLTDMIDTQKISYHYINARPKGTSDFKLKLRDGISYNPESMQDLAGIRVICYVKSDVDEVCKIIENKNNFEIDYNRSMDRSRILGEDKMGYSSIHYVAKLPKSRTQHDENRKYEDKFFEIQVRTILQHAWAEIQHDEMYKSTEELEPEVKRRFYLVSSILESADNEFNTLHQKWKYKK